MSGNQVAVPMTQVAVPVVLCNLVILDRNNCSGASFIFRVPALKRRILVHGSWKNDWSLSPTSQLWLASQSDPVCT